jgi:hypothetical protein
MAPARTEVTGLFAPWLGPHCSEDATKVRENGVARFFAARRIGDQVLYPRSERMYL